MERPPDSLKCFADRIARFASSGDAAQLNRMLRLSGLLGDAANGIDLKTGDMVVAPHNTDHLGIWERKIENGKVCFVRRMETIDEWHYCANLGRIEAKGARQRIVFLGESVARGYLYDPEFNPAFALEKILEHQLGENEIEVIDLARTNQSYEVREMAISALQLEPDIAIIFAGNNWGVSNPRFADIAEIDEALANEGMAGAKRISDEQISRHGRQVVSDIATAYEKAGVPLVWIIPEFNLGDWRDPILNAPYLADDLNRQWLTLLEEAQRALSDGEIDKAKHLAQRVVEIDQGICVAGFYLLAECCGKQGDIDGQRKYLEMARDAATWDSFMTIIPRPYSITQQVLRDEMAKHKSQVVDLPALFKEHLNGELPDRRLFLDYCHLATEGIQIAMAAVATCVLHSLKGKETPWHTLLDESIVPPPKIEAEASFLAAIHNAHRWQSYDLVRHYCLRALKFSPHVAEMMINYIEIQTRPSIPMSMSESQEKIFKVGSSLMHKYLFRFNEQRLDTLLLDAIVDALAEIGIHARERLDQVRRDQHSIAFNETNLLDYYYYSAAQQPLELARHEWANVEGRLIFDMQYYQAYGLESRFVFVGEAGCPLRLRLTCRLPYLNPPEAAISVALNGNTQAEIVINHEWSSWDLDLPGEAVRDGVNEVTVRWPIPEFESRAALKKVVQDMCAKKFPDFYPVFGEIHSFTASRAQAVFNQSPGSGARTGSRSSIVSPTMERPPESLKFFANRIARIASQSDAPELIRLMRLSGLQGGTARISELYDERDTLPQSEDLDHVGIWERKVENGNTCFVRRMDAMAEWHFWASLGRIEAKGVKRRVVLIGESVARGYLYDPEFNPALALEKILEPHFGEDGVEIIDLARTALDFRVRELAIAALQLQPDIAIIFAGNNWNVFEPSASEIAEIDEGLSQEGIGGAKRICETQIERNARRVVNDIASTYESSNVPLIWIIPEFNLGDWRDPITNAPRLGKGLNREWLSLLAEAQSSLRDADLGKARELANRMIEIDKGVCVAGFYLLAECSKRSNDIDGERKYLELARDSMCWDLSRIPVPRPYRITQSVLREATARHKYQLIDLPILFKEYLNGGIPGRRLFHDYCHMTAEGIQVAMGAAASCVLRTLKGVEMPWQALVGDQVAPPDKIEAEASFLAAILNGHAAQTHDVVHYFCARALNFSPHIAELMLIYIDFQSYRLLPKGTSKSEEQIAKLGSSLMQRYLLRLNQKRLDKLLIGAIVNALEEIGIDAREKVEQLRREEHSVAVSGEINLLDYYYCSATAQAQELAWLNPNEEKRYQPDADYYRAYWPESRFVFIGEAGCAVTLRLTCRLPGSAPHEQAICVLINGQPQVEMVVNHEWSNWDISLDGQLVLDGLNEVAVRWPIADFDNDGWLESLRQKLFEGKFPEFYPVFGEIHSFTASRGQAVSTSLTAAERELAAVQVS